MNQDCVFASAEPVGNLPNLFIVADGMGGHNAGDFASRYTVDTIREYIEKSEDHNPVRLIRKAVEAANAGVRKEARENVQMAGMGTTVVVTTVIGNFAYTANVGDSRLYLYDGALQQVTTDHSLVEEMVRMGEITREQARMHPDKNIITRAIGAADTVDIDFFDYKTAPGSTLLMCSDGLFNMVSEGQIAGLIEKPYTCEELARHLIFAANDNGGKDNIAVIVIRPYADEEE